MSSSVPRLCILLLGMIAAIPGALRLDLVLPVASSCACEESCCADAPGTPSCCSASCGDSQGPQVVAVCTCGCGGHEGCVFSLYGLRYYAPVETEAVSIAECVGRFTETASRPIEVFLLPEFPPPRESNRSDSPF